MGFLQNSGPKTGGIYLEIAESPKSVRPTVAQPTSVWIHTIPEVKTVGPNGLPVTLRKFTTEACTSNSRSGAGCQCCSTQDPLWHLLDAKTKVNRKGQRTDFPKKCINLLPVWDHAAASVRAMKGGNQLYEVMDQWFGSQPDGQKDLRRCDWQVWKTGKSMLTKYNVVRQDVTAFNFTQDMVNESQIVLQKAIADLAPQPPEIFLKTINGDDIGQQESNPLAQFAVSQVVPAPLVDTTGYVTPAPLPTPEAVLNSANFGNGFGVTSGQSVGPVLSVPSNVPATNITTNAQTPSNTSVLTEFTSWINAQPEFVGTGVLHVVMPVLQEHLHGSTDYYKCTPEQLTTLRKALTVKLDVLRNRS